jgi:pyridoxal phosphate enzyme (YggS family)
LTSRRSSAEVADRVAAIRSRIGPEVELVAVTKGFGPDAVRDAVAAGCTMVGENYAQELLAKWAELGDVAVGVHFIGRLQSNKVRQLASRVDVWESVDRPSLIDEIAVRQPGASVLVQVNATGEPNKGGCEPDVVGELVTRGLNLNLNVSGLMTVGPTDGDAARTRRAFRWVRTLADELGLTTCSMGMSHDLDIALECGTTRVRVGTALFGPRPRDASRVVPGTNR